ncbi:hypothetical protein EYB26_003356 [Talaromyces marneffei]|uniref:uncharacterized protein n=1 Tax=Talaromyces marneffei TaxID=37727 RepID=UPI0012A91C4B|nr:uncharacterized protein EYB26_003356 [Talaromyces marneffei]QGA15696.1 hypothetical protein EYB26_003356 [Talaromyces marneffei]
METPKGAPEAAGVPNSTGDGMGVLSSGWGGSVATEQHLAEALQGSLQEQLAPGNASAGLERSLISGLTGAMRASSNEPIEAASSKQTGSNPHKRAGPILGDEEDQANVPFAIRCTVRSSLGASRNAPGSKKRGLGHWRAKSSSLLQQMGP